MNGFLYPLLLVALLPLTAHDQDKPAPSVTDLITQLGSKSFKQRETAAKQLRDRGPVVLPALKQALTKALKPEQRVRLYKMIGELETVKALSPTMVKLNTKPKRLADVLDDLKKQTGYRLGVNGKQGEYHVTFSKKQLPFWQMVKEVEQQLPFGLCTSKEKDSEFTFGRQPLQFSDHKGIFRLRLIYLHEERDVELLKRNPVRKKKLIITYTVTCEPKFILLELNPAKVTMARDELGQKFPEMQPDMVFAKLDKNTESFARNFDTRYQKTGRILLNRPDSKSTMLRTIKGTVPVRLVLDRNPVVLTNNPLRTKRFKTKLARQVLELHHVVAVKGIGYRVSFSLSPVPKDFNSPQYVNFPQLASRVHLETAQGYRYEKEISGCLYKDEICFLHLTFLRQKDQPPPTRLIFEDWKRLSYDVPFEFRNVPLP